MENKSEQYRKQSPVKVGRISYINVAPIYYGLDKGLKPAWLKMVTAPPSVLNNMLANGDIDISPISSVAYALHQKDWLLLPDLSIACSGDVMSVILGGRNRGRPLDYWFTNNFMYDIQIICHVKPA